MPISPEIDQLILERRRCIRERLPDVLVLELGMLGAERTTVGVQRQGLKDTLHRNP
jgi:hypothetical protein